MKQRFVAILVLAFALAPVMLVGAGSEQIIKQRAKDLRDQNNARQGVTPAPPAQPGSTAPTTPQPAAPAVVPAQTPRQQAMANLQKDLAVFRPGTEATAEQRQKLANSLVQTAQGSAKPSMNSTTALANELAGALSQKLLSNATRGRLLQNLGAVLNPGTMPASQVQDVVTDIQSIFKSNGLPEKDAARVADAARVVAGELQKKVAK